MIQKTTPGKTTLNDLQEAHTTVKLIDFDLAGHAYDFARVGSICGTKGYMAPELFITSPLFPTKLDVYALGVTFRVLIDTHFIPTYASKLQVMYLPSNEPFSSELRDLIASMTYDKPSIRINMDQVISHPWFGPGGAKLAAMNP